MAQPITWRNVIGPSLADAGAPLNASRQSFNDAFNILSRTLENQQAANQRVYDEGQAQKKLSFQELLQGAKSADDITGMQGQLDGLRGNLDAKLRTELLGAEDKRRQQIQSDTIANRAFADKDALYQYRDQIQQAQAKFAQGDQAGGLAILGPIKDKLPNYGDLARQGVEGDRAAQRFGFDVNREGRSAAEESRRNQMFPLDLAGKKQAQELTSLQIDDAKRKADEAAQQRAVDTLFANAAAKRRTEVSSNMEAITQAAKDMKFDDVYNRDGSLNISSLTAGQRAGLDQYLKNIKGPTIDSVQYGDTRALEEATRAAIGAGYTAKQVDASRGNAGTWFDTTGPASIGNDAAATRVNKAMEDALLAEDQARYGVPITKNNLQDYMKAGEEIIGKLVEPGSAGYRRYLREFGKQVTSGGYKVVDPVTKEETRFLPSLQELPAVIARGNNWLPWATGYDVEDGFDKWTKSKENIKGSETAIKNLRQQATRSILDAAKK